MKKYLFSNRRPMFHLKYIGLIFSILLLNNAVNGQIESEPNNSFDNATAISFDQVIRGVIVERGDKDYYRVEVLRPGVLIARLTNIPQGRTYILNIFNPNKQSIGEDSGNSSSPAYTDRLRCTTIGTHYILVNESGNDNFSPEEYELTVSFNDSDIYECNNTFEEATSLQFDTPVSGAIFDTGDKDYFKIETTEIGVISAQLKDIANGRTYELTLFNQSQQNVANDNGNSANPARISSLRCSPGIHYLLVNESGNDNSNPQNYELVVSFNGEDKYECNNSFADAKLIDPCNGAKGNILPTEACNVGSVKFMVSDCVF